MDATVEKPVVRTIIASVFSSESNAIKTVNAMSVETRGTVSLRRMQRE